MSNQFTARNARALMWSTALTAIALPSLAWAQTPPAQGQPSATQATSSNEGEVIIVTAQRRAERLENVPMTVAVANAETLEATNANSLRDINRLTSGVMLNQGGAFPAATIRGVTSLANGTSFENNVAIYIDGFYQTATQGTNIDLPNVSDVQVLKGPQGTLYGRNATGGAILINTVTPGKEWQGKVEATYAKFNDWRIGGYFAGPVTDWAGISIAAYTRRTDGYFKLASRTVPGATDGNGAPLDQDAIRLKLKLNLSNDFSAIFGYNYTHISDARGNMFSDFENVSPFINSTTRPQKPGVIAFDHGDRIETWSHEGTMTLSWDTGIGALKSYTSYTTFKPITSFDFDGTYLELSAWSTSVFRQKTFQQSVDYAINAIPHFDLVVGGNYFKDKLKTIGPNIANYSGLVLAQVPGTGWISPAPLSNLVQNEDRRFTQDKKAWALYFDATWHVTDKLHLNVGGRYSHEDQDVFASSRCFITPVTASGNVCRAIAPDASGNRFIFPATNNKSSYSKFTPRASIRYEIAPRTNVYASYSQGFRSGAWNASLPLFQKASTCPATNVTPQNCTVVSGPPDWKDAQQEVVDAFEIGFKTAQRKFRFETSAFLYKYKDLQVSVTQCIGQPVCVTQTVVTNAPKANIKGLEASAEYKPIENLNLRGNFTWLHARYGSGFQFFFTGVNPNLAGINVNSDPLRTYQNVTQLQDLSGLPMSRAPNFSANLGFTYDVPMNKGGLRFAGNAFYTSKYVVTNPSVWCDGTVVNPGTTTIANSYCASIPSDRQRQQRFTQGSYVLLSGSIQFTMPDGHAYVRVWGNNLTDKHYKLHYTGTAFGSYQPLAEPRTYGVTAGFKF
jgi:iron complex outermembrane recepter protein